VTCLLTIGFDFFSDVDLLKSGKEDWERSGGRWRIGEYMQKVYDKVGWVFALLAAASVGVQGVKTVYYT
jgi:predicted nucleotidyltransferase